MSQSKNTKIQQELKAVTSREASPRVSGESLGDFEFSNSSTSFTFASESSEGENKKLTVALPPLKTSQSEDSFKSKELALENENKQLKYKVERLESRIGHMQDEREHAAFECQSLNAETQELRMRLTQTAEMCHTLAKDLDMYKKQSKEKTDKRCSSCDVLKKQVDQVVQANVRWQTYNNQREEYVKHLLAEIESLKKDIENLKKKPNLTEEQQKEIDKMMLAMKAKINEVEGQKELLEDELRKFKILYDKKLRECEEHGGHITELEQLLQSTLEAQTEPAPQDVDPNMIGLLQEQIRAITEDFEAERRDREKAHTKIGDLESELMVVKTQLREFHQNRYQGYPYRNYMEEHPHRYNPYGDVVCDGASEDNDGNVTKGDNSTDGSASDEIKAVPKDVDTNCQDTELTDLTGEMNLRDSGDVVEDDGSELKSSEYLQCPRCYMDFATGHENDLEEHVKTCNT